MGTGKQYDEEFKKQAIKLASFMQQTSGSNSSKRKTVSLKSLMNFWRKHLLTVGSVFTARLWRLQDKHFMIISAIKTPPGSIRHLQMK